MHKGAVQAQHWCTAAASARRCSVVAPAASPAHKAQLTTALMAQGWCHESVDIATAQGAVQQLRATVPHRSSVAAAAVSPLQRRRCTKRMWTTGLHSWHKLTGVRIHCHCTRCCAAPEIRYSDLLAPLRDWRQSHPSIRPGGVPPALACPDCTG